MKNPRFLCFPILFIAFALLTACGGGGSSSPSLTAEEQALLGGGLAGSQPANKASDYSGTWSGFAQTNLATSEPFTVNVSSANDTTAAVTFASAHASGTGAATYDATTHYLAFHFTTTDSTSITYTGTFSKMGATLTLKTLSGGAITSGTGSCTPLVVSSKPDLTGIWTGTSAAGLVQNGGIGQVDGGAVTVLIGPDSKGGYIGVLNDSTGDYSGVLKVTDMTAWGSPGVWDFTVARSDSAGVSQVFVGGGIDLSKVTFGADGKPVGGLKINMSGPTAAAGPNQDILFSIDIQRK